MPQRYFLSATACRGILRRAEKRGKVLPEPLRLALERAALPTGPKKPIADASEDGTGRGTPLVPVCFSAKDHGADAMHDLSPTLRAGGHSGSHANAGVMPAVAFSGQMSVPSWSFDQAETLQAKNPRAAAQGSAVRRLTPRECERLQGFPDDYTLVPYRKGMMADGPRYKALGNSMAVPVMRWIGERIASVEALSVAADLAA